LSRSDAGARRTPRCGAGKGNVSFEIGQRIYLLSGVRRDGINEAYGEQRFSEERQAEPG
jgi:hypothetical protein